MPISKATVELIAWNTLRTAHETMRAGQFTESLALYRKFWEKLEMFWETPDAYAVWWQTADEVSSPSLNWLCIFLCEFYQTLLTWTGWRWLSTPLWVQPVIAEPSPSVWSRLVSTQGWSDFRRQPLRHIIAVQNAALERLYGKDLPFEEALHHIVLCYAHQLAFHDIPAQQHLNEALARLDAESEPYYTLRALMIGGAMHRVFDRFDAAIEMHYRQLALAECVGARETPLAPDFVLGWDYMGAKEFPRAFDHFTRAIANAQRHHLHYETARYLNGLGYAQFVLGNYEAALSTFQQVIDLYWDNNHPDLQRYNFEQGSETPYMRALCLHNMALVKEYQGGDTNLRQAMTLERAALELQRPVDDPGPLCDMLRRAIRIGLKQRNIFEVGRYTIEFGWLRLRYPVPTVCPPLPQFMGNAMRHFQRVVIRESVDK